MLISLEAVSEREFSLYPQLELGLGFALARFQTCFAFLAPCKQSTIFTTYSLAVLKGDLQRTRGKSKGEGRKGKEENCEKAWSSCFHTSPFLEEAIICLHYSHPVVVTLEKGMWVRLSRKIFPIKSGMIK